MSDAVKKQAEGVCTEISEKNDWTTFHIDVGRQYPLRLQTKLEALVKQGREARGQKAVWTFSESQGGENPNKPGTYYINRRLEKVEVGGSLDPSLGGRGSTSGGSVGRSHDDTVSIQRQTIVKAAISVFPSDQITNEDAWFTFITKVDEWVNRGSAAPTPTPAAAPPPAAEQPEEDDSDIPF